MRKLAVLAVLMLLATALIPSGMAGEGKAAPRSAQRCVLFELFSNVNNTNCADDENATARLAQDYARSRLAILEWFQPGDPLACPEAQSRYNYYLVINPPKAEMDGSDVTSNSNNESQTYAAYKNAFATEMNRSASANITAAITQTVANATVNATVTFAERTTGALTLYCFVYEDGVYYAGKSNVSYHKYVVRKQAGKAILNRPFYNVGENTSALFHFDFASSWNRANVGLVLALQSDAAGTIHQSALFPLGAGATYAVDMSPQEQSIALFAGKNTDVAVQAKNNGTATDNIDFSVNGPAASWGSLSKATASLSPGQQTQLTVSVAVPVGTAPGDYMLKVRGTSRTDPGKYSEATVDVTVKEEVGYGVSLSPATASVDVTSGDSATFQLRVRNTGTVTDTFDLSAQGSGSQASWATLSRTSIQLPANGEDTATLTVSVPSDTQAGRYDFTVKAVSRSDPTQTATAQATVKVTRQSSASYAVGVAPKLITQTINQGNTATLAINVTNTGTANDTYDLSKTGDAAGWATLQTISVALDAGATGQVDVDVTVPGATPAGTYTLTVRATSRGDTTKRSDCTFTFNVQVPEVPPAITSLSATPSVPTSRDLLTVTAVVTGSSIDHVDLGYYENAVFHQAQRMTRNANTYTMQIGPFKEKTIIRYKVTAYSTFGKTNSSNEQTVTVKANPPQAQQTPGFEALALLSVLALAAAAGIRRKRSF
jgi:hypothetical protein